MIIAAVSDVHTPRYFAEFVLALDKMNIIPDLFLIAGDMIDRGEVNEYEKIYNALFGKITCPIVACFGNQEYSQIREELKQKFKEIRFLDDQSIVVEVSGTKVGIFGTTGCLDTPTGWQKANVPNIEQIYQTRYNLADKQLQRLPASYKILLMHYAPTYKTLEGENPRFFSTLGSQYFENILLKRKPNLVIHGHSHRGTAMAWIDTVPVFNVAFLVNRKIVIIDTEKLKPGLAKFV
ncbi:MAG: metallophosphoesterase [Candidatus Aenigmatarchaeota archaeon]